MEFEILSVIYNSWIEKKLDTYIYQDLFIQ